MQERKTRREEAAELEAKAKAIRRAERAFWEEVEGRAEEVKIKLGLSDIFDLICQAYDANTQVDRDKLLKHIISASQVDYYKVHNVDAPSEASSCV